MYSYDWLRNQAIKIGVSLSDEQLKLFSVYERFLASESQKYNLTAVDQERVIPDLFLDSLSIGAWQGFTSGKLVADIGSGAGFPGVPLKIAFPDILLYLIESQQKKSRFLESLLSELGLNNSKVLPARAEDIGRDPVYREKNNIVVARAVANLNVLLEYALPLLAVGGSFLAQKGPKGLEEVQAAKNTAALMGGDFKDIVPVDIIPQKKRFLIVFQKVTATSDKYPRRSGLPSKRPLTG